MKLFMRKLPIWSNLGGKQKQNEEEKLFKKLAEQTCISHCSNNMTQPKLENLNHLLLGNASLQSQK